MVRTFSLGLLAASLLPQGGTVAKGDRIPESKLSEVIWSWDGAESLNDYRGEPVLVDFWGTQ